MISVDTLYNLAKDIIRKDHTALFGPDEFNRAVNFAQRSIFDFFLEHVNEKRAQKALESFYKEKRLPRNGDGRYSIPADFEDDVEILVADGNNYCADEELDYTPAHIPSRKSLGTVLSSPIRKSSPSHYVAKVLATEIQLYPATFDGVVKLRYYATPGDAEWAYTVDSENNTLNYDASNTVDLQWDSSNESDFLDIVLLFKGIKQRDNALINWVASRNQLEGLIVQE